MFRMSACNMDILIHFPKWNIRQVCLMGRAGVCDSVSSRCPTHWLTPPHVRTLCDWNTLNTPRLNAFLRSLWHQPHTAVVQTVRCTMNIIHAHHDGEDQGHDVDRVRRTKAGENSQTQVATQRRWRFLLYYGSTVKKHAPAQGTFHLWIQHSQSHSALQR